jgi:hypothetical protein
MDISIVDIEEFSRVKMCVCNEKLRVSDISGYVRVLYSYQNT